MLTWEDILARVMSFSEKWKKAKKEEADAQPFVLDFIKIFGLKDPLEVGAFEVKVLLEDGHNGYIDYLWPKKIAIEMKSPGKDLKKAYSQLKDYAVHLNPEDMPDLLLVCDFFNFHLYHRAGGKKSVFKLADLRKHIREFAILAGFEVSRTPQTQPAVNVKAAEKMAFLHDALKGCGYSGHNLEVYLVRLLFCLFADGTGIFPGGAFLEYLQNSRPDGSDLAARLGRLFEVLNIPLKEREKYKNLPFALRQFQYINGNLFEEILPQADFDAKMRNLLLECAKFDWSKISPAIFGSIFQGVMDKERRKEFGAHYTSEENILKLINPLFMDELWEEFEKIKTSPAKLDSFHEKLARLQFLDPACGCGNFLIIAYRELRRLELAVLKMKIATRQAHLNLDYLLKVNVNQFAGIEIEEFPARIAQVGMWLMDHQMNMEAAETFGSYYVRLPLRQKAGIKHANALKIDWQDVTRGEKLSYIIGNPPFAGARMMKKEQKQDLEAVFSDLKNCGDLDFVSCWFKKADQLMRKFPQVKTAFVATNSIIQGIQPALLWKPILENGCQINFAWRTFKWHNDAKNNAGVYCVIVGFSRRENREKFIFTDNGRIKSRFINGYLADAKNIFIESRLKPISDVPEIGIGNKPVDGGNFLFSPQEKELFLLKEPGAEKFFHKWVGGEEFIHNRERYCLWLGDCAPDELKKYPECIKILKSVREFRLGSKSKPTRKLAEKPAHFHVENMPKNKFLVIPKISAERRKYLPAGFLEPEIFASDLLYIMENCKMYHFAIISSSLHNVWIRAVAGRLGNNCRYSKDIVYNNFPWPETSDRDRKKLEKLAQKILDVRSGFAGSSLADLYDPLTMPQELLKAHQSLDRAVFKVYGLDNADENVIVARLLELYSQKKAAA